MIWTLHCLLPTFSSFPPANNGCIQPSEQGEILRRSPRRRWWKWIQWTDKLHFKAKLWNFKKNKINSFKISCFSLCNLGERVRCTSHVITGCNYDLSSSDESCYLNCLSLQSLSLREEACILSGGAALTQSLRRSPPSSIVPKFKDRPTLWFNLYRQICFQTNALSSKHLARVSFTERIWEVSFSCNLLFHCNCSFSFIASSPWYPFWKDPFFLSLFWRKKIVQVKIHGSAYVAVGRFIYYALQLLSGQVAASAGNFQHGWDHEAGGSGAPGKRRLTGPLDIHLRRSQDPSRHPSAPRAINDLKPIHGPVPRFCLFLRQTSQDILI